MPMPNAFHHYRHTIGAGIIAVVLGLPFGLKLLSPHLEIYPAVLLPAGAGLIKSDHEWVYFTQYEIIGLDLHTRAPLRIKADAFLHPVPMQALYAIIGNQFGLNPNMNRDVRVRRFKISRPKLNALSNDDREFTQAWLRARLKRAGCSEDLLTVRIALKRFSKKTGTINEVRILDEKNYPLR